MKVELTGSQRLALRTALQDPELVSAIKAVGELYSERFGKEGVAESQAAQPNVNFIIQNGAKSDVWKSVAAKLMEASRQD